MTDTIPTPATEWRKTLLAWSISGLILLGLSLLVWTLNRRVQADQHLLDSKHSIISNYTIDYTNMPLAELLRNERQRHTQLTHAWTNALARIGLAHSPDSVDSATSNASDHIDFKVALIDARRRLHEKAAGFGATFPSDLGIRDVTTAGSDASIGLCRLNAVETLLTLAMDQGVKSITHITLLESPEPEQQPETDFVLTRHPIAMEFEASLGAFDGMLKGLTSSPLAFSLTQLRIERKALDQPDQFKVMWVCDALKAGPPGNEESEL